MSGFPMAYWTLAWVRPRWENRWSCWTFKNKTKPLDPMRPSMRALSSCSGRCKLASDSNVAGGTMGARLDLADELVERLLRGQGVPSDAKGLVGRHGLLRSGVLPP